MSDWKNRGIKNLLKSSSDSSLRHVRLSISFDLLENARLEYLIQELDVSKQHFIDTVISNALYELEMELGLRDLERKVLYRDLTYSHPMKQSYSDKIMESITEFKEKEKAKVAEKNQLDKK